MKNARKKKVHIKLKLYKFKTRFIRVPVFFSGKNVENRDPFDSYRDFLVDQIDVAEFCTCLSDLPVVPRKSQYRNECEDGGEVMRKSCNLNCQNMLTGIFPSPIPFTTRSGLSVGSFIAITLPRPT